MPALAARVTIAAVMPEPSPIESLALFIGILVGIVTLVQAARGLTSWWRNRKPHPSVTMCVRNPVPGTPARIAVTIVNDSAAELNIIEPAALVVDDPRYPFSEVRVFSQQRVDTGNTRFPKSLGRQGRIISTESMSQLADDLRMLDCWESCLVRGQYLDAEDRPLQSLRYLFDVKFWLEPDASALRHTPSGPKVLHPAARLRAMLAERRARPLTACRELADGTRDMTVRRPG